MTHLGYHGSIVDACFVFSMETPPTDPRNCNLFLFPAPNTQVVSLLKSIFCATWKLTLFSFFFILPCNSTESHGCQLTCTQWVPPISDYDVAFFKGYRSFVGFPWVFWRLLRWAMDQLASFNAVAAAMFFLYPACKPDESRPITIPRISTICQTLVRPVKKFWTRVSTTSIRFDIEGSIQK